MTLDEDDQGLIDCLKSIMIMGYVIAFIVLLIVINDIGKYFFLKKLETLGYYAAIKASCYGKMKSARAIMRRKYKKENKDRFENCYLCKSKLKLED